MAEQFDMFSEEASRDRVVTRAAFGVVKLEQPTIPMNEEDMVRYLSETGRYRILRKLVPRAIVFRRAKLALTHF